MEPTTQLYLLYDEHCPLCNWYTKQFIRFGFIAPETRLPYSEGIKKTGLLFDKELAKNKIALVNAENNQTIYGIDSLLTILGKKLPLIKKIGNIPPIHFLLEKFYNFISYNRKVIAPVRVCETDCDCAPDKSIPWRIVYIVFAGIIVHLSVGFYFNRFLTSYLTINPVADGYLYSVQFAFQLLIFKLFKQRDYYNYAGHLATTSLIGAILLTLFGTILNLLNAFGFSTEMLGPLCFGIVLTAMFVIHSKRIHLLGYTPFLTLSWVIFRLSIYFLVFKLF